MPPDASPQAGEPPDWERIAHDAAFRRLLADKARFLVPATLFFIVYYFALPVLVAYAPGLMEREIFGKVNVAYAFALSQFFMAWILAGLYVRAAARWDREAAEILRKFGK
ncbi:MAG: DUF485 domain-containing protein [Chthoniobacterales bacterium]